MIIGQLCKFHIPWRESVVFARWNAAFFEFCYLWPQWCKKISNCKISSNLSNENFTTLLGWSDSSNRFQVRQVTQKVCFPPLPHTLHPMLEAVNYLNPGESPERILRHWPALIWILDYSKRHRLRGLPWCVCCDVTWIWHDDNYLLWCILI